MSCSFHSSAPAQNECSASVTSMCRHRIRRATPHYSTSALQDLLQLLEQSQDFSSGTGNHPEYDSPLKSDASSSGYRLDQNSSASSAQGQVVEKPTSTPFSPNTSPVSIQEPVIDPIVSPMGHLASALANRRAGRIFNLPSRSVPPRQEECDIDASSDQSLSALVHISPLGTSSQETRSSIRSSDIGSIGRLYVDGYDPSRSSCFNPSTNSYNLDSDYQPGPISAENQRYDPDLQASFQNYRITYSRHVFEAPVSPKSSSHAIQGDWINAPPVPAKRLQIRLGPHCTFHVDISRGVPHHTTSRARHYASKTLTSLKHVASPTNASFKLISRKIKLKRAGHTQTPCLKRLRVSKPFVSPLDSVPELEKRSYKTPKLALFPEELPGDLEMSEPALLHHNILVNSVRYGAKPENEDAWLKWVLWRSRPKRTARSIPQGWSIFEEIQGKPRTDNVGSIGTIY